MISSLKGLKTRNDYLAILLFIKHGHINENKKITELCKQQGISRQSYYRFEDEYKLKKENSFNTIIENKRNPIKRLSIKTERKIINFSYKNPSFGKTRIYSLLMDIKIEINKSTITLVFKRYRLNTKQKRKKTFDKYDSFEALWKVLKKRRNNVIK